MKSRLLLLLALFTMASLPARLWGAEAATNAATKFSQTLATEKTTAVTYVPGSSVMEVLEDIQRGAACRAAIGEFIDEQALSVVAELETKLKAYALRQIGFAVDADAREGIIVYGKIHLGKSLEEEDANALLALARKDKRLKIGFLKERHGIWFNFFLAPPDQNKKIELHRNVVFPEEVAAALDSKASVRVSAWMTPGLKAMLQAARLPLEEKDLPQAVALALDFKKGLSLKIDFANEQAPAAFAPKLRAAVAAHAEAIKSDPKMKEKYLAELKATTVEVKGKSLVMKCPTDLEGVALEVGIVLRKAQEKARAISCTNNLKQLLLGIVMYVDDHKNKMPNDLTALVEGKYLDRAFVCPKCQQPYRYFGKGLKQGADNASRKILLACPADHLGRVNVGCADGHVESVPRDVFEKALSNRAAGALPVLP